MHSAANTASTWPAGARREAAGIAAALSLRHDLSPRKVDRVELQTALIQSGGNIGQALRAIPGLEGLRPAAASS